MSYGIYLASLAADAGLSKNDDRLRVRIIPQMNNFKSEECPLWSFFFRDQIITGKVGDLVWVICDDEFSAGYILGYANYSTYETDTFTTIQKAGSEVNLSIPASLRKILSNTSVKVTGHEIDLANVKVSFWNDNCIHLVERSTGGFIIIFRTGTLYVLRPDACYLSVGGAASLKIDSEGIELGGANIHISGDYVGLGKSPSGNVLITNGQQADACLTSETVKA